MPIDSLYCCVGLMQVQPELAKLLELKAKLSEITDADPSGGKFVLKCPKVSQPAGRGSDTYMFGGKKVWDGGQGWVVVGEGVMGKGTGNGRSEGRYISSEVFLYCLFFL